MTFVEMLRNRWQQANSMVCVGLDSDFSQIPNPTENKDVLEVMRGFNVSIVSMTRYYVCVYKPNIAFYEDQWMAGLTALKGTIEFIRAVASDIPVILDAKRTDIGNTNKGYVKMAFDILGADAITVNPYFGGEALKPFLDRADKGVIVLCRTSNPGAKDFQDIMIPFQDLSKDEKEFFRTNLPVAELYRRIPLYQLVAYRAVTEWNRNGNVLLVVGATYPAELRNVRKIVGNMPILVPGIGAQQGDLEATVKAGIDNTGFGMIINSSRGVIFASKGPDFAEAAGKEAKKLRDSVNEIKASILAEKGSSP